MKSFSLFIVLIAGLTACGSGNEKPAVDEIKTSAPTEDRPSETPSEPGESDDCRVAASIWADKAQAHVLDAATTAPVMAQMLELEDLEEPASTIKVLCSDLMRSHVTSAAAILAEINFELSLCGFDGTCDEPTTKAIRKLADKAATDVGQVNLLIE